MERSAVDAESCRTCFSFLLKKTFCGERNSLKISGIFDEEKSLNFYVRCLNVRQRKNAIFQVMEVTSSETCQ